VVCQPNDHKPARPVAAAEQEHTGKDGEKPDDADQDNVVFNRTLYLELGAVVDEADRAGSYE